MVMRGVMVATMAGFLWLAEAWLAYGLFVGLSPSFGVPLAAVATAAACLAILGIIALAWPKEPVQAPAATAASELVSIARIAEERPFLGIALSALIGAGKAIEQQGRSRP